MVVLDALETVNGDTRYNWLCDPGIEPRSPELQADSESQEKLKTLCIAHQNWEFES